MRSEHARMASRSAVVISGDSLARSRNRWIERFAFRANGSNPSEFPRFANPSHAIEFGFFLPYESPG